MGQAPAVRLRSSEGTGGRIGTWGGGRLRPLSPHELRRIGESLRRWFAPAEWRAADLARREELARGLHRWIRDEYGLPDRDLVFANEWEKEVWGDFQPETKDVRISPRVLLQDDPTTLLDTLAHENRHAVQYELVEQLEHDGGGPAAALRADVDWVEVTWWREATHSYLPYRTDHWKPYFYNPLEVDAREAGTNLVDRGYWAADRARRQGAGRAR
jgi:hypothetical protein